MYLVENEQFEGPLDLLLSLIEKEKLEITALSLSKITADYLNKIEKMEGNSSDMSDFLVIAAKLLYIKSRELLPDIATAEEEAEIEDLETKLREYSAYKKAAEHLQLILGTEKRGFNRRAKTEIGTVFVPPKDVTQNSLFAIFQEVLNKAPDDLEVKEIEESAEKKISIDDKKIQISKLVKRGKSFSFREILKGAKGKTEIIVTFLAVLEMIKQKEIGVKQEESFADILIVGLK